jgi:hypothetical protein
LQLEEELERVVQLFAFVADKDVFGDIYRNQLSKRILNQRSVSNDAERSMISKLKCVPVHVGTIPCCALYYAVFTVAGFGAAHNTHPRWKA